MIATIDLGIMLAFFKVADKTGTFSDIDVFSLHDLRMTTCALELFPSFEIFEVDRVVECNLVEHHLSFQKPFVMAAFLQATFVPNLGPGLRFDVQFCPVTAHHDQPFDLFAQLGPDAASRRIMAYVALDIFMGRGFPAFKIGCHEVAGGAKFRSGCEFYRTYCDDNKKCDKAQKDDESFFLFLHGLFLSI